MERSRPDDAPDAGAPEGDRQAQQIARPTRCILCDAQVTISAAGFTQLYRQGPSEPVAIPWWECSECRSWFAAPHPTPEQIARNWQGVSYNNPADELVITRFKTELDDKLLAALERYVPWKGTVLDYGSNFGRFLERARAQGWVGIGVEAFAAGIEATRSKGFTTYAGWELEGLDIAAGSVDAIVENDVFCYVWNPYRHLQRAFELLRPGGALLMRATNKRFLQGLVRATTRGARRGRAVSAMLQGQFHSTTVHTLARVLTKVGFRVEEIQAGATTAPPSHYGRATRALYSVSGLLDRVTAGAVNVSPGVCIVASKPGVANARG
jgi:SAM-dependent methyltransferase